MDKQPKIANRLLFVLAINVSLMSYLTLAPLSAAEFDWNIHLLDGIVKMPFADLTVCVVGARVKRRYKCYKRQSKMKHGSQKLSFIQVERKHQEIILDWFKADHVKEFYYGEGLQNTLRNLELYCQGINNNGKYSFDHWIAYLEDEPLGFLMTSSLEGPSNPDNSKWYIKGKQTFTLDLLIGPKAFLGRGLASRMIQEFILDKFSHADYFIIDPAKSNPKAIHVYERAGFKKVDEFCPAYDPIPHLMMRMAVQDLKDQVNL